MRMVIMKFTIDLLRSRFKEQAEKFENIEIFLEENNLKYTPVSADITVRNSWMKFFIRII